ncbi:S8 family serine peptidase [Chryseobacterium profundimaris]|uniref:Por secretion system C-terminal sorting domain-containing protein n=1 Tax=Chryseobacterium profundimaris TaxID=1387275 RepID=A0ABY1NF88_9FLAO|nr:S8 family serine peptidase [Chryseobacterium profundimaris]SMP07582.1 Por secretion system C-terminal sorting domain-containing protein [Chryseobacterium profundimaris]
MKNRKILLVVTACCFVIIHGQSTEERNEISSHSNKAANIILQEKLYVDKAQRNLRLSRYLNQNPGFSKKINLSNYGIRELVDALPSGELIFAQTDNAGASITARTNKLYSGGTLGLNIQGQNMIAGVWDGGSARTTHQEFMVGGTSKLTNMDGAANIDHATHVTGTICAQGILSTAKGIAFNASVFNYDWNDDLSEMLSQAYTGLLTSNHSYGFGALSNIWFFGAYDSRAKSFDEICYNNPYYLPVVSAGNSRNDTTAPASTQLGNKGGYDLIFGHGNAKNVMTVGAVNEVSNYIDEFSVTMSSFSSWGPSDDGRIKPDISTKGVGVRSTLSTSNTATGLSSGTSMASPGITGVVLLLQQYYNQLYSNYMRSSTVKGLILHTADEAGNWPGPDYEYGWGLVNAEKAAIAIRDKNSVTTTKSIIDELVLNNSTTYTKTITASGTAPLKISISWTDPQSPTINTGTVDPTTKYLVNDLDIKVTKDGTTYYPWKMQGMSLPFESATNISTNDVDNFERVDINNPSGTYTITVTHKGILSGGSQNFSLIATAGSLSTLNVGEITQKEMSAFYPNPTKDYIYINENESNLKITVYDVSGKMVLDKSMVNNRLDVSSLIKGNYVATYVTKKGLKKNFTFIKE